ncbi:MAG TPA: pyrroline-5-carboxylate reductase [Anaerolineales bacterium]|nr:pyrroline-5-carboxylate reductase [Anaerolineales bacterium]
MLSDQRIVFIGPGVMAEAMVGGLVERAGVSAAKISLSGPRVERLNELESRFGVGTSTDNRAAVGGAGIVVVSVKPQSLKPALDGVRGAVPKDALVLSIVAGASLAQLARLLDHPAIVRAMPNTPAQVGEGITVWTATDEASEEQREHARHVLGALGQEIYVEDEDYLDMATALSGTGPAYVYLFMEAMVDAGVHLGFPRRIAEQLVAQTVKGSVAFYLRSPRHLARLRNQVTSPGGTSAAALYYLEKAGFRTALSRAIWAAYERSVQLGLGRKRGPVAE